MTKHAIPVLIITTLISYNAHAAVINDCLGVAFCPEGQTIQHVSKPGCTNLVATCVATPSITVSCRNVDDCGDVTCTCNAGKCKCTITGGICNSSSECSSGTYTRYICQNGYYGTCTGNASAASYCTCTKCPNFDGTVWANRSLNLLGSQYGYTGGYVPLIYSDTTGKYITSTASAKTGCYLKASSSGSPEYEDSTGYFELTSNCKYTN